MKRWKEVILWLLLLWIAVTVAATFLGFFMPLPEE